MHRVSLTLSYLNCLFGTPANKKNGFRRGRSWFLTIDNRFYAIGICTTKHSENHLTTQQARAQRRRINVEKMNGKNPSSYFQLCYRPFRPFATTAGRFPVSCRVTFATVSSRHVYVTLYSIRPSLSLAPPIPFNRFVDRWQSRYLTLSGLVPSPTLLRVPRDKLTITLRVDTRFSTAIASSDRRN